ncbi:unnamed protein product [Auanema sp. JU1783]|nr:unnamed protein product [Auanema sp. JU1783]
MTLTSIYFQFYPTSPNGMAVTDNKLADPLKARLLLTFGGPLGLHRLYLSQISEAFIYLSTCGLLFLGVLYDVFVVHSLVNKYNDNLQRGHEEFQKFKNGRLQPTVSKHVKCSVEAFITSTLYSMWLGWLCWLAVSIVLRTQAVDNIFILSSVSIAVSSGIYICGNRGNQTRNLLYVWISTFSAAFLSKFLYGSILKTLFISSLIGTIVGNRTAKVRLPQEKSVNVRHFIFWSSLFLLLICIITTSSTRHILEQKVSSSRGSSTVVTSVGSLVYDRFFEHHRVTDFFRTMPRIDYKRVPVQSISVDDWWGLDVFSHTPAWADYVAVFIVDLLRAETRLLETRSFDVEPLRWACWRMFLLTHFDVPPGTSDNTLAKLCIIKTGSREKSDDDDYLNKSIDTACDLIQIFINS